MREILVQGPVQAIFKVYPDIFMYKQGVYQWSRLVPELHDTYHSVKILGWGTENGVDYWVCEFFLFFRFFFVKLTL
jgi:cathepsin B